MSGSDNHTHIRYCAICHRSEETAGGMMDLPGGLSVCPDCMQKVMNMASNIDYQKLMEQWNKGWWPDNAGAAFSGKGSAPSADFGKGGAVSTDSEKEGALSPDPAKKEGPSSQGGQGGAGGPSGQADDAADPSVHTDARPSPASGGQAAGKTVVKRVGADDEDDDGDEETPPTVYQGHPNVSFVNLGDIFGGMQQKPRVKKKKKTGPKPVFTSENIPAPHLLKAELDKYVIGQEKAKKTISVAAYNHYKRVKTGTMDEIEIEKSNILLIGPTGAGKTYLVRTLARLLDVPLAITDATSLTEAGYIGDDVESCISKLLAESDNDVERAQKGIVFIDEIDKLAKKQNMNSRDVSGEAVQQGLLKLLEGSQVEVPVGANSKNGMVPMVQVDTTNILFICGGAFPALEEIIRERLSRQSSFGFSGELRDRYEKDTDILSRVTNEDLRAFGMIPEFIGRLPIVCTLQNLDEEMLVRILREPKNAILKQYQKLLALDEVTLDFEEDALHAIAQKALKKDTGARALRSIIEEFMLDIMYEIPKDQNIGHVVITADYVNGKGGPKVEIRQDIGVRVPAVTAAAQGTAEGDG